MGVGGRGSGISIAAERRGKRAKTDRLDVDLLLTTLIGWPRGEPGRCTMAPIPSEEEEDLREPGRRRETLIRVRLMVENQIASLLIRQGIEGFKPRLKNAGTKLGELRTFDGQLLPANTMKSLGLLLTQHRLLSAQLHEIEAARQQVVKVAKPDRLQCMILALARVVGVGVETAIVLVYEVFSRSFKDRRALAASLGSSPRAGLTGTPYSHRRRSERVWKTAGYATALWGARFAGRFPHPLNAAPKSSYCGSASPALPLFPPTRRLEMLKNQLDKPNPIRARGHAMAR